MNQASLATRLLKGFLLTAGMLGVGVWAVGTAYPLVWQRWANGAFERQLAAPVVTAAGNRTEAVPESVKPLETRQFAGRLTIPGLGMQVIVREGDDSRTLAMAAGHIPGTAMPGQPGNVGIAGHRDTLFRGLGTIRLHDLIQFDSPDGKRFEYEVESTSIHNPADVEVLNAGAYPELTLVTCYPFNYIGPAPQRFIVKARQLGVAKTLPPLMPAKYEVRTPANTGRVYFTLDVHRTRKFENGMSLGLSDIDPERREVNGWLVIPAADRVVWLRDQRVDQPFLFYGGENQAHGMVMITGIQGDTASGWFEVAGT